MLPTAPFKRTPAQGQINMAYSAGNGSFSTTIHPNSKQEQNTAVTALRTNFMQSSILLHDNLSTDSSIYRERLTPYYRQPFIYIPGVCDSVLVSASLCYFISQMNLVFYSCCILTEPNVFLRSAYSSYKFILQK